MPTVQMRIRWAHRTMESIWTEIKKWQSLGVACIPIQSNTKRIKKGVSPLKYTSRNPSHKDYTKWFCESQANIAVVTREVKGLHLCVVDFDSYRAYCQWKVDFGSIKSFTVKTRRGRHVYFWSNERPSRKNLPKEIEVKHSGQPVMCPPSRINEFQYRVNRDNDIMVVPNLAAILPYRKEVRQKIKVPTLSFTLDNPYRKVRSRLPLTSYLFDKEPIKSGDRFYMAYCPGHDDSNRSLSIDVKNGLCSCFVPSCILNSSRGFDVVGLNAVLKNMSNKESMEELQWMI